MHPASVSAGWAWVITLLRVTRPELRHPARGRRHRRPATRRGRRWPHRDRSLQRHRASSLVAG